MEGAVDLNQATTLTAGTYTSSSAANFAVCSAYNAHASTGCVANPSHVQSIQFHYTVAGTLIAGGCLTGGSSEYLSDGSSGACNSGTCGFNAAETDTLTQCPILPDSGTCGTAANCVWVSGTCAYNNVIGASCASLDYDTCYENAGCIWVGTCISTN